VKKAPKQTSRTSRKTTTKKKPAPKATAKAKAKPRAQAKPAPAARKPPPRADLGAPVDGFFVRQPAPLRPILEALREMVEDAAPEASSAIKWGMPFYMIGGNTVCALAGFKSHVNLILPGPPGTFDDPDGRLEGEGKTGKHLKLRTLDELPRAAVRRWLQTAADRARAES
jgi:hypothetical protein